MKNLSKQLSSVLSETRFDLDYTEMAGNGKQIDVSKPGLTPPELARFYETWNYGIVNMRAEIHAPCSKMLQLADEVRIVLGDFIGEHSDSLRHAFPINQLSDSSSLRMRQRGLFVSEFATRTENFAKGLVQAAAIIGVEQVERLLTAWIHGGPIRFRISTILNGLPLKSRLPLREDIQITPLPLTTAKLPRMPRHEHLVGRDYLGLPVLSLMMSVSPSLSRPSSVRLGETVETNAQEDIDLNVICDALSLQANCHVTHSFLWVEYEEAGPFSLSDWQTWSSGDNYLEPAPRRMISEHPETGVVTIARDDDVSIPKPKRRAVLQTMEALREADNNLRIALARWKRSKRPDAQLEDRFIDLRLALEMLYLKDLGKNTELRFRLSLYGAWHLGSSTEERKDINKKLRNAYDMASRAVHTGEVPDDSKDCLEKAQDLCRDGILKLLLEDDEVDWGDLILGGSL